MYTLFIHDTDDAPEVLMSNSIRTLWKAADSLYREACSNSLDCFVELYKGGNRLHAWLVEGDV